jgi:hypothetical protein
MNGNKTFLAIFIGLFAVLIFSVVMTIMTTKTLINPTEFSLWQPKPMNYKGELVEKWSVMFVKGKKYIPEIAVRKNGWHISNDSNHYLITENGLISRSSMGFGLDDENSSRTIESDFWSLRFCENAFTTKYAIDDCEYFIADKKFLYCTEDLDHTTSKIDINTGKTIWKYTNIADSPDFKPPMYIVKDKLVLNTFKWGQDKDGNPDTPDTVTLVDLKTGKGQVIDIPGSVIGTAYKNELYLIIDDVKVSKFDTEKMCLTGKMFDIRNYYKKGEYHWNYSNYWFTFSSDGDTPDLLLNPNTMELCKLNADFCDSTDFLYHDYWLCWIRRGDKIIGIDTETFEETWVISAANLGQNASVVMGDERGILVQYGEELICFGPP